MHTVRDRHTGPPNREPNRTEPSIARAYRYAIKSRARCEARNIASVRHGLDYYRCTLRSEPLNQLINFTEKTAVSNLYFSFSMMNWHGVVDVWFSYSYHFNFFHCVYIMNIIVKYVWWMWIWWEWATYRRFILNVIMPN